LKPAMKSRSMILLPSSTVIDQEAKMEKKPEWLKVSYNKEAVEEVSGLMAKLKLNTVCKKPIAQTWVNAIKNEPPPL